MHAFPETRPRFSRTPKTFGLSLLLAASFWLGAAWFHRETQPRFGSGIVEFPAKPVQIFAYPFSEKKLPKTRFTLKQDLELPYFYPTVFAFYPQDVLWAVNVNGHPIEAQGLPLSAGHHEGRNINLAPFLHPGANEIELTMEVIWGEGIFRASVSPWDKNSLILSGLILSGMLATTFSFCRFLSIDFFSAEMALLLGGFFLRCVYLLGTPYFVRAYDYWGHIDYLDFVSNHLSLPDAHSGWESFQPPLYYLLLGGLTKVFLLCGMADDQRISLWQAFSFLCSLGVLIVGFPIARILYEKEPRYRLYLLAVLAVAPSLVLNASRVTNDALLNVLDFLWLALLLRFWKQPDLRTWLGLSFIASLALLTKASALVLLPISILCLVLVPRLDVPSKILATLLFTISSSAISGWYYVPRAFHEHHVGTYIVGNLSILTPKAHIDGIFLKSLVFNPVKVLRYPFAEPWGPRHEYFPEVFFKTIFLGEWIKGASYKWLARLFVLAALLLIPPFLIGVFRSLRNNQINDRPLFITLLAVFVAHWAFVQIAPFISSQDFRYSLILLVPMVYFLIQGISWLPPKFGDAFRFLFQLVILNAGIYTLELALSA